MVTVVSNDVGGNNISFADICDSGVSNRNVVFENNNLSSGR